MSGRVLQVAAFDLLDGRPILDVKPYLPYADSFPDAAPGSEAARQRPSSLAGRIEVAALALVWRWEASDEPGDGPIYIRRRAASTAGRAR